MTRLQFAINRACQELGLTIVVPFTLMLDQQVQINSQALLPQLGASKGMMVVNHFDELRGMADDLVNAGYGYSVLEEPLPKEEYDLDVYMEMFSDWGWGATNEKKPTWID